MNTYTELLNGKLELTFAELGEGKPVLMLHGGGGPASIAGFAEAMSRDYRVLAPTHPGFNGTPRVDTLDSVEKLAQTYLDWISARDLRGVLLIGFSMGGWIASSMAAGDSGRLRGAVLVNAVGIEVEGEPIADVFGLAPQEIRALSFHAPEKFRFEPTPQQAAMTAANFRTLAAYGKDMRDPRLKARLAGIAKPALVAWGESDRIATPAYGRAYAAALGNARFAPIDESGHMPQIEQPEKLMALIREFDHSID
ncbi:MAG TPA: alpha/beta hydrolase [Burkholderiaceae bacterium]